MESATFLDTKLGDLCHQNSIAIMPMYVLLRSIFFFLCFLSL